jgi:hypothetical protein
MASSKSGSAVCFAPFVRHGSTTIPFREYAMTFATIRPALYLVLAVLLAAPAQAQQANASGEPLHNLEAFAPLDLHAPNQYRAASGRPGPEYWQQRADYAIQVTLDPAAHRISGTETITYTNNSPQDLEYLWLQLDQNLFRPGSRGSELQSPDSRWRGSFEGGGFDISRLEIVQGGNRRQPEFLIEDTMMRIMLDEPLPANGGKLDIVVDFAFTIPQYGADRMGRLDVAQGTVYEIAQWYPRMYVFDDVNGWNVLPYLGQGEFYLEYGDINVDITVPRDFIVVATGELQNPQEVLTAQQQQRLDQARRSAETVMLVRADEVGQPGSRPAGSGPLTWRFRAENVRDFAWAASQAFIWDAASYNDVLIMSAYPREGLGENPNEPGWEMSTEFSRHSVQFYSEMWYPYPYPVAINVAGVVAGMEYPMIVFCGVQARGEALFGVTDHELGHTWFPMIVGSDERRHAWMDEGFDTYINQYSNLAYYGEASVRAGRTASDYIAGLMQSPDADQPSFTYPDRIRRTGLGFLAYRKPGKGLIMLREHILGQERFDAAFREYIERWAYKHPQPTDFFRTVEDVAGEDLDWFWRGWFYSTDLLDQSVAGVATVDGQVIVTLHNDEGLVMPVDMLVTYSDGQTERRRIPVEAWMTSDTVEAALDRTNVVSVTLDPDGVLPDVDRADNTWRAGESNLQPRG